jgi:hypothetical protein
MVHQPLETDLGSDGSQACGIQWGGVGRNFPNVMKIATAKPSLPEIVAA